MAEESIATCPFCEFTDSDTYVLMLHVETLHSEGESPFRVREDELSSTLDITGDMNHFSSPHGILEPDRNDGGEDENYVICPEEFCGEAVLLTELDPHIDMHVAEKATVDELPGVDSQQSRRSSHRSRKSKSLNGSESSFSTAPENLHSGPVSVEQGQQRLTKRRPSHSESDGRGWRSFLIGSNPPRDTTSSARTRSGGPRRLGVCLLPKRREPGIELVY